jgi:hypothetical protein
VIAVKRVRGMRLVGAVRKRVEVLRPALAPAASRVGRTSVEETREAVSARIAAGLGAEAANDPITMMAGASAGAVDAGLR